jgi:sec-independent protein translocase protein TatA
MIDKSKFMNVMFGLFNLGGSEIILILALVLILFGAKKLPELAKGLGQGIKEFKKATREVTDEIQNSTEDRYSSPRNTAESKRVADAPYSAPQNVLESKAAADNRPPDRPAAVPQSTEQRS